MNRLERIRAVLEQSFTPEHLVIEDESGQHAGHAGAASGRGHFYVEIVSAVFAGKSLLARHRLVYAALGTLMQTDIHALRIQARTSDEASRA
ncbi:MAG: BolA family transcriptional regulator [Nevskiales bacterium]|nr:BolA family transcriptional regulator [Nevskiales bacterium]